MLPCASQPTTTTFMPAITALAGLVPCADEGISTTSRWWSPAVAMPGADDHQAGELALGARVRLQPHGREAGDVAQRGLEARDDLGVAGGLVGGRERMHAPELRPRHRLHVGRGVQLHRAGAERDHRGVEADVLALERLQETHHRRFRVIAVEHRVREERGGAAAAPPATRARRRRRRRARARPPAARGRRRPRRRPGRRVRSPRRARCRPRRAATRRSGS